MKISTGASKIALTAAGLALVANFPSSVNAGSVRGDRVLKRHNCYKTGNRLFDEMTCDVVATYREYDCPPLVFDEVYPSRGRSGDCDAEASYTAVCERAGEEAHRPHIRGGVRNGTLQGRS